jgi:hypothetical protein
MLHAVHSLGFRWQPANDAFLDVVRERGYGVSSCSIPLLTWLLEAGCPVDWPAVLAAAEGNGHLSPVVKAWLQERSEQG